MTITRLHTLAAENQAIATALQLYGGSASYPTISATKAKTGGYSYRQSGYLSAPFGRALAGTSAIRCGCWLNHNGITRASGVAYLPLVSLQLGATAISALWDPVAAQFRLFAGYVSNSISRSYPVVVAVANNFASTNTWFHVGLAAKIASSDGFVSLYIDGQQVLNWTGDTRVYASNSALALTTISGVYLLGGPYHLIGATNTDCWKDYVYADDAYIDDSTGEADYPLIGKRFLPFTVTGAGSLTQLTPTSGANYAAVAEAPPDEATSYVKGLAPNLTDLYTTDTPTIPTDHAPRAVIMDAAAAKTEAGLDSRLTFVLKNANAALVGASQALGVSFAQVQERFPTDPDNAAWTSASAGAVEKGYTTSGAFA